MLLDGETQTSVGVGSVMVQSSEATDTLLAANRIPIVDLAHMGQVTLPLKMCVKKAADQLQKSLTNTGLVLFVNHGITEEKLQTAYKTMDRFCALPEDIKAKYNNDFPRDNHGYLPPGKEKFTHDIKEEVRHSFNICSLERKIPDEVPGFLDSVGVLIGEFKRCARLILQLLAVGLDLAPDHFLRFHEHLVSEENASMLRLLLYPALGDKPLNGITRCGEHTDYGMFTLLCQDSEGGLEVLQNDKWNRVGHLPGAILMNTGDLFEMWTSKRIKALRHRVVIPETKNQRNRGRHSIAFFVHPDNSTMIEPIIESIPVEPCEESSKPPKCHPCLINAYQHLQRRLKQSRIPRMWGLFSRRLQQDRIGRMQK